MPRHWGWWTSSAIWMTPSRRPPIRQPQELAGHPHRTGKSRPGDKFLRELFDSSAQALAPHLQSWLPAGLGKALLEMNRTLDPLTRFNDPQGTYAFCPVCLP